MILACCTVVKGLMDCTGQMGQAQVVRDEVLVSNMVSNKHEETAQRDVTAVMVDQHGVTDLLPEEAQQ